MVHILRLVTLIALIAGSAIAEPSATMTTNARKATTLSHLRGADAEDHPQPLQDANTNRDLQEINVQESLDRLFNTAPDAWTTGQWFLAAFLLILALWCCGCLSGGRRYYRRRGSYYGDGYGSGGGGYRSSSSGCCGCLQNLLMCFCCYELCCADCQDVPCCDPNAGQYLGGAMV